jgi:hypothetical protein
MQLEIDYRGDYYPLDTQDQGRDRWRVDRAPVVRLNGQPLAGPEIGFVTDAASVPWWARWKFTTAGRHTVAAVFHDWLLQNSDLPKWEIDWLFLGIMKANSMPDLEATIYWLAVRTRPGKK